MLTDAELMKRHDSRISEADWKTLITYWRSLVFESHSAIAKKNRAMQCLMHPEARVMPVLPKKWLSNLGMILEEMKYISKHICARKGKTKGVMCRRQQTIVAVRLCRKDKEDQEGTIVLAVCMN